jgi:hypothetical protein
MSRGVLMHAHNNEQVDYGLIAICNALLVKWYLKVPVCLVTDEGTVNWLRQSQGSALIDQAFDQLVEVEMDYTAGSKRFGDTPYSTHTLPWYNTARSDSFRLSPFEETLLIDVDYLIFDKALSNVWGAASDIMINRQVLPLNHGEVPIRETWLEQTGIRLYWATCLYFRKTEQAEMLFSLVSHIKHCYPYYSMVYGFPTQLFRNDYAFSIAIHMLNGFTECNDISSLPFPTLLTSFDCDDLIDVPNLGELVFLVNNRTDHWKFALSRTMGTSVHVMNKFAIIRQAKKIINLYGQA